MNNTQASHAQLSSASRTTARQHPRTFRRKAHMAIKKTNKLLYSTAISRKLCARERKYTAHMHKQQVAFVRLGRSRGIFSLKCKSTLQRCPKKVTIIMSSMFMHVHVLNSCSSILNLSKLHTNQTSRKDEQYNTQASHAQLSSASRTTARQHPRTFRRKAHMAIQKANKLLHSTAVSRKLCSRERKYTAHMYKQHVAFVRLGRSRGIFSLKCKSTLQRCPKKVTIIISSMFMHVHVLNC